MKWLIASDIHGSAFYCRKLLDAFEREKADRMLLLGDNLYHGARGDLPTSYDTKAVTAMLNEVNTSIIGVRGNCDSEIDQTVLKFPIMSDYSVICIGSLTFFASHGHIYSPDCLPPLKAGDILLSGHTHVPHCEMHNGILCLNPGSVSVPKNGSANSYMTFSDGLFMWKDLDGTVYKTYETEE